MLPRPVPFDEVILQGLAPGGGLFVPEEIPALDLREFLELGGLPYWQRASRVFERFQLGFSDSRVVALAQEAYGHNFDHPEIAPLVAVGSNRFVLELWHGPTFAFKDLALQCMPLFFSEILAQARAQGRETCDFLVLAATSGDTGAAALSGFADRPHTRIAVCYPNGGVSPLQERQMITQPGENLIVLAVEGDFDTCQKAVKTVFSDTTFAAELRNEYKIKLTSANSINWGRLLPQLVYYLSAYADLVARGHCALGEPVDICVPTGNFGNILAAYYAKRMGLPVGLLICASNANRVLADFLATGTYEIAQRRLVKTPSPSMDILVSSNLERLLYEMTRDGTRVRAWMDDLNTKNAFRVDRATYQRLQEEMAGDWVDNQTCLKTIRRVHEEHGYLIDPHTAVAWEVADRQARGRPLIVVSTAHWSKFPADVVRALRGLDPDTPLERDGLELFEEVSSRAPGCVTPEAMKALLERPIRFSERVTGSGESLKQALRRWLSRKRPL